LNEWSEERETKRQIRRFAVIGGLSVLADVIVYAVLIRFGARLFAAKGISYVAGMIVGFIGNKFWTFESNRSSIREPIAYLVLYALTLVINVGTNGICISVFKELLPPTSNRMLAFLVATGITTVLNFFGLRFGAFRQGIAVRRSRIAANDDLNPE
jgi:putative flippase GtrA